MLNTQNSYYSRLTQVSEIPQISKHQFTAKLSFSRQRYSELDLFRQQIELSKAGIYHKPYTSHKKHVGLYKCIFFGLSILFTILGITATAIPSALGCGFFSSCTVVRGVITVMCLFFSLCALSMACHLRTEREAVLHCVRQTLTSLATLYSRKCIRMGIKRFFAWYGPNRRQVQTLKQMYQETVEKINEKKDETLHLVHRIKTTHTLNGEEKEALINQAIEELQERLMLLSQDFRHATLPSSN